MTTREEIASIHEKLGDLHHRLAVLYLQPPPSGGQVPATSRTPPAAGHDEPAEVQAGDDTPRTGRALFAWAKDNKLLRRVDDLARSRGYSGKIVNWSPDQVADVYQAVTSKAQPGSYRQQAVRRP